MAVGNNISAPITYKDRLTGITQTIAPASAGGYMKAYDQYAASAEASKQNYLNDLTKKLNENNATTNSNYDNSARQAYVDYMRKQRALPSQLQALGVRGGATESGLLNLYNNYGTSHAANEQQRNADLTANQHSFDDAWSQYRENYDADLRNQYQTALNNQMNEYNNEVTRFSSTVAQYPSTEKGYEKYKKWIENLSNSSDPLKDIKVALVRQQMASQFPNGKPSGGSGSGGSSGGGGSSRSYSSGGGGGGNNGNTTTTGDSMTDYYKSLGSKVNTYKNTKTKTVSSNKKRGYNIHGESSKNWQ